MRDFIGKHYEACCKALTIAAFLLLAFVVIVMDAQMRLWMGCGLALSVLIGLASDLYHKHKEAVLDLLKAIVSLLGSAVIVVLCLMVTMIL